eukprot:g6420.t1
MSFQLSLELVQQRLPQCLWPQEIAYYTQLWRAAHEPAPGNSGAPAIANPVDTTPNLRLSGRPAFDFLSRASMLTKPQLKQIWTLADWQSTGGLGFAEFAIACRLIFQVQAGGIMQIQHVFSQNPQALQLPNFEGIPNPLMMGTRGGTMAAQEIMGRSGTSGGIMTQAEGMTNPAMSGIASGQQVFASPTAGMVMASPDQPPVTPQNQQRVQVGGGIGTAQGGPPAVDNAADDEWGDFGAVTATGVAEVKTGGAVWDAFDDLVEKDVAPAAGVGVGVAPVVVHPGGANGPLGGPPAAVEVGTVGVSVAGHGPFWADADTAAGTPTPAAAPGGVVGGGGMAVPSIDNFDMSLSGAGTTGGNVFDLSSPSPGPPAARDWDAAFAAASATGGLPKGSPAPSSPASFHMNGGVDDDLLAGAGSGALAQLHRHVGELLASTADSASIPPRETLAAIRSAVQSRLLVLRKANLWKACAHKFPDAPPNSPARHVEGEKLEFQALNALSEQVVEQCGGSEASGATSPGEGGTSPKVGDDVTLERILEHFDKRNTPQLLQAEAGDEHSGEPGNHNLPLVVINYLN